MVLPVIVDLIYQEGLYDLYLIVIGICLVLGYGLMCKKERTNSYFAKEGMLAVGIAWIVVSFFGGLPFYLSGEIPSFVDCFFEVMSGFTTPGSSVLTEVENLKHATLFWRSFTQGLVVWVSWFSSWPYFQSQMIVVCISCVRKHLALPLVNECSYASVRYDFIYHVYGIDCHSSHFTFDWEDAIF
jgi:Trk-type K+ transport system membrane component